MRYIPEETLRMMCDKYQTVRDSKYATWVTLLRKCHTEDVSDLAELALDSYNQTERKNFKLEKVCKLNSRNVFSCMTFRARNAETDECRLFRGVVVVDDVLLCEIMDGDTIKGVGNHVAASFQSKEAHYPRTRYNASTKSSGGGAASFDGGRRFYPVTVDATGGFRSDDGNSQLKSHGNQEDMKNLDLSLKL